jgi:hypothetical protein
MLQDSTALPFVRKVITMPDETTVALQEIAGLLRHVEQQDEMAKRSEERLAKIAEQPPVKARLDKMREEGNLIRAEMMRKMK